MITVQKLTDNEKISLEKLEKALIEIRSSQSNDNAMFIFKEWIVTSYVAGYHEGFKEGSSDMIPF